jgi:phosphoglycerate dehydrogenase-like enzyme
MSKGHRAITVEDDPFLRVLGVVLDPATPLERRTAFADFFANDEPDFDAYCARVRARATALFPCEVRLVKTQEAMREALPGSAALVIESLCVADADLALGSDLRVVQKFGSQLRNIDTSACAARGVKVLTLRRRANIACAEHAMALMLMLTKRLNRLTGRISVERLAEIGLKYKPFDRRHTPNSNWARIPALRILYGTRLGIIGLGEIGREIAMRAAAFGMRIVYHQRHRLAAAEENELKATFLPLEELLAQSDWVVPQLPGGPATRGLIGRAELARMKPGAFLVNIARADIVDREALIEALRARRLGGFALDPLYEAPGRADDELFAFDNVVLTPHIAAQPRFNVLDDLADMMEQLAKVLTT